MNYYCFTSEGGCDRYWGNTDLSIIHCAKEGAFYNFKNNPTVRVVSETKNTSIYKSKIDGTAYYEYEIYNASLSSPREWRDYNVLNDMLEDGCDPTIHNDELFTYLVGENNLRLCELLLAYNKNGKKVNVATRKHSAIRRAIFDKRDGVLKLLQKWYTDNDIVIPDEKTLTKYEIEELYDLALLYGQLEVIRKLHTQYNFNLSTNDCELLRVGYEDSVEYILKNISSFPISVIQETVDADNASILKLLLDHESVDISDNVDVLLSKAVEKRCDFIVKQYDMVELLLSHHSVKKFNLSILNSIFSEAIVNTILSNKNIDPFFNNGVLFRWCCFYGYTDLVKLLVEDDRIDFSSHYYHYGIGIATVNGYSEIVNMLKTHCEPCSNDK